MTLKTIEKLLREALIEDSLYEAVSLIEHYTTYSKAHILANKDEEYYNSELVRAVERRLNHEPLQYIMGKWSFMGYDFIVSPDCLIPRQDTEIIAELAIRKMKSGGIFADLCTGSGCIAISTLLETKNTRCVAVELVEKTAKIAIENAKLNKVYDRFQLIVDDIKNDPLSGKYDLITANPPYISIDEMDDLSKEVLYEPRIALTDEGDGLSLIRIVIETGKNHIKDDGEILIEIGYLQGEAVRKIAKENDLKCEIIKDIENRDRVARLYL